MAGEHVNANATTYNMPHSAHARTLPNGLTLASYVPSWFHQQTMSLSKSSLRTRTRPPLQKRAQSKCAPDCAGRGSPSCPTSHRSQLPPRAGRPGPLVGWRASTRISRRQRSARVCVAGRWHRCRSHSKNGARHRRVRAFEPRRRGRSIAHQRARRW